MNDNELKIEVSDFKRHASIFKKVPASQLSIDDDFLKYIPKTRREKNFKDIVEALIKKGLNDFWRPVCDPSFDEEGHICYELGNKPALGKSYEWWEKNAEEFCPERGSRLGTKSEYIAFLAVLCKELVATGKPVEWVWNAVCNDSEELGYYRNSSDYMHTFKETGDREICGFCDLANTYKILAEDEYYDGYWLAGGSYYDQSDNYPLAGMQFDDLYLYDHNFSCGWLVLDSCPDC